MQIHHLPPSSAPRTLKWRMAGESVRLDFGGAIIKRAHPWAGCGGFVFVALAERNLERSNKQLPKE